METFENYLKNHKTENDLGFPEVGGTPGYLDVAPHPDLSGDTVDRTDTFQMGILMYMMAPYAFDDQKIGVKDSYGCHPSPSCHVDIANANYQATQKYLTEKCLTPEQNLKGTFECHYLNLYKVSISPNLRERPSMKQWIKLLELFPEP